MMTFFYRVQDCLDKFCAILKSQKQNMLNIEQRNMIPLTIAELELCKSQKLCYICRTKLDHKRKI